VTSYGDERPHVIYVHCDASGTVLYVGCTVNLAQRTAAHKSQSRWFSQVASIEIDSVQPNGMLALYREREVIREHEPAYNIRGNPGGREGERNWQPMPSWSDILDGYTARNYTAEQIADIAERVSVIWVDGVAS
jgi:hypothetical protein